MLLTGCRFNTPMFLPVLCKQETLPPLPTMCYLAEPDRSALKGVGINRGEPKKWGRWSYGALGWGVADRLKTSPLPICVMARQIWSFCVKGCVHK